MSDIERNIIGNIDIAAIATPEEGLAKIKECLRKLRIHAGLTDFRNKEAREVYLSNVAFMKNLYERVDYLLLKKGL